MKFLRERSQRLPLLMAGVVALLLFNTAISATRYLAIENRLRLPIEDSPVWATAQLEVELARFLVALDDFGHEPPRLDREQLVERFDVAWSRLALFSAGVNARWLDDKPAYRQSLDRLQAALEAIDPQVASAEPGQQAATAPIRDMLLPHLPVIKQLTAASVQEEIDDRASLGKLQGELRGEIQAFSLSALAAFLGLTVYLVRAEARSRASVRELSRAQAEAEAARARLSEAIANINEGFVMFDPQDRLVLSNAKYREYYALSADSIRPGASFEAILRAGIASGQYEMAKLDPDGFVRDRLARRRQPGGDPFEQRLGDGRWLMISDRRTRDGGLVGIRTDITEIKRREQELEDAKQTLQRQAEELRLLAERERRANAAKSEFLATLSHEIRTPMNAVVGLSDLLAGMPLDGTSGRYVAAINEASSQLLHLINTILDLSRLEAGRSELDLGAFALRDMLERLSSVASALAASKPVTVACRVDDGLPPFVLGDQGRLYQVLLNLLGNSVKFTDQGSVVISAARSGPASEARILFEIADTGPGLPAGVVDRLFEPFVRGPEAQGTRQGGTGLGLAISKRFVDLMGGRIGVASTSSRGTTFFVELSLPPADAASVVAVPDPKATGERRTLSVLVAEDTPSSRMVVQAMLERLGHSVTCVENGREAVEAVIAHDFDVVLMDMQMPELDGVAATRAIRRLPDGKSRTPIVFLTAQALADARRDAAQAGTDHYLTKPTRLADLRAMLDEAVSDRERAPPVQDDGTPAGPAVEPLLASMELALAELREAFDTRTFRQVIARFEVDARERVDALRAGHAAGDAAIVRREAHKLAGILGQVGMGEIAARARAASHAADDAVAMGSVGDLVEACRPALAALATLTAANDDDGRTAAAG